MKRLLPTNRFATAGAAALALLALVLPATAALAQPPSFQDEPAARTLMVRREANLLLVNGRPSVLMWAAGLDDVADLDQYAEMGMNTVYLTLPNVSDEELAHASSIAAEAQARGLMLVLALAPQALFDEEENPLAPDPYSEQYAAAVTDFATRAADALADHPALIAWSLEAVPPDQIVPSDESFLTYLADWYPSLDSLDSSWAAQFTDWEEVSIEAAFNLDQTKPGGLGRATVDFGYYCETLYADLVSLWTEALRQADPARLVFASALTDYRSIISLRPDLDGMILNTYPSLAEADWRTHNVHAVDIARRANQFAVVHTLEVGVRSEAPSIVTWGALALQHGAAGIAFSSWPALRGSETLASAVRDIALGIREEPGLPVQPRPHAAILYQPLAGGAMRDGRGLYGYLDGFAPDEPSTLFAVGRNGSRFGQFDVLSLDSLSDLDIRQYSVIIAPMALYLPEDAQLALHNFVMAGGALLADAGIAMYQADGLVTSLPDVMKQVLGMRYGLDEEDWSGASPDEVQIGDVGDYGQPLSEMPEEAGLAYNQDLLRLAQIVDDALDRPDVADRLGLEFLSPDAPKFRVNTLGQGYSVYAPRFLYDGWDASDPYFVELHSRLLANGATIQVEEPWALWPQVSVGLCADWSVSLASPDRIPTALALYGAGNQVYRVPDGAMRLGNPQDGDWVELLFPGHLLSISHPLPIYVRTVDEGAEVSLLVTQYDADRIELLIHGAGAQARPQGGAVALFGGVRTPAEIEILNGTYPVLPGSVHRVLVTEGAAARRAGELEMMPNPDTGGLLIQGAFTSARITIEPAPEVSPSE